MRAVGTREGLVVAYLKARVFPRPFIPAIKMAGYPYYAPLGLPFPLGYPYYAPMGLAFPLATLITPRWGSAALRTLR